VFSLFITSDHPDFNGFYTTNYVQADEVNGTGSFWGYAARPLKCGDTVFIKFRSHIRRDTKADGTWEAPFEGTFEFVSGTGKYAKISGKCPYQGVATTTGSSWSAIATITY